MTTAELYHAQLEGEVLILTLQNQAKYMADSAAISERQLLPSEYIRVAATHAVVDFNQLSYFTSMLLEALLQLWKSVKTRNGRMALCNLAPIGREIIAVPHFDRLWPICDTREQALQAVLTDTPR
jgi:anti-anti-sigma factor